MKIDAQLRVNKNMRADTSEVASGWVEIEDCIKFPVKVRKYVNDEGKEKMFVTYPQRKTEQGYSNLVYPDKEVKEEMDNYILTEVRRTVMKGIDTPPITDVRVNLMEKEINNGSVQLKGYATIKIAGFTINGIMIKESQNGLFVQMPQHKSGGAYKDTVYGTNRMMQMKIKDEVLSAFEQELEKRWNQDYAPQEKEESNDVDLVNQGAVSVEQSESTKIESNPIDMLMEKYRENDIPGMIEILKAMDLEVEEVKFTANYNAVKSQIATMESGEKRIFVQFSSEYEPMQVIPLETACRQKIEVYFYEDGQQTGHQLLTERKTTSLENAEKNYKELLNEWKELTNQKSISFRQLQPKNSESVPKAPKL